MQRHVIRWRFAVGIFLIASCKIVSGANGADPEQAFRHLLTLPLDFDPQAKRSLSNEDCPCGVAFSPDGKTLAAAFNAKGVLLFDLPSGKITATIKQPDERAHCVDFTPDGKLLAHGGSGAWLWDLESGQTKPWVEHPLWAFSAAFSPNGKMVAVGTSRQPFRLWDLATGKSLAEFDLWAGTEPDIDTGLYKPHVAGFAFSPDGKTLAAHIHFYEDELTIFDQMQIWDLESHKLSATFRGTGGLFTPDGQTLICGLNGKIMLRNTKSFEEVETIEGEAMLAPGSMAEMALSGDGKMLATNGEDYAVQLWNIPARKLTAVLKGHERWITSIAFSADGTRVASACQDGSIRLWALEVR